MTESADGSPDRPREESFDPFFGSGVLPEKCFTQFVDLVGADAFCSAET